MKPFLIWSSDLTHQFLKDPYYLCGYDTLEEAIRNVELRVAYDKGSWSGREYEYIITSNTIIDLSKSTESTERIITL